MALTAPVPARAIIERAAAALAPFAAAFAVVYPAAAQTPSVRLGPAEVRPYVLFHLDEGGTFGQDRPGGQAAGFNLRRGRLGAQADVADEWQFGFVWDFGAPPGTRPRLFEARVAYAGLKPFTFSAGAFNPSFTHAYAQYAGVLPFLEYPSITTVVTALVADQGRVAGEISAAGDRWFAAAMLTGARLAPGQDSEQRAVLGRAVGLVVKRGDLAVHLGLDGAWLFRPPRLGGGGPAVSFSDQPELNIDSVSPSLSTGSIAASGVKIGGVEAGVSWGRLWLFGEWYGIGVDRRGSRSDPFFSGWYAHAAYTLLGTPRQWVPDTATWEPPTSDRRFDPANGEWGRLEVAARVSTVDLNSADVRGGRQRVWSASAIWSPVAPLRLLLQYQHAAVAGGPAPRRLNAVAVRGQLGF